MMKMSLKCEEFLKGYWDEDEISKGIKNPIKFIREVVNPYLKSLRKKGKNVPIIHIKGTKENPYFILSTENKSQ